MNFRKSSKRGGGHFQSKNLYCKIWTFKQGYLTMKLIQRGLFRLCFSTIVLIKIKTRYIFKKAVRLAPSFEGFVASLKNLQYNFPKMRGGEGFGKFDRAIKVQICCSFGKFGWLFLTFFTLKGEVGGVVNFLTFLRGVCV